MKFDRYYISSELKKNLKSLGFKRPTDIQFKAIPSILNGEDVLAIAQTGTGKTAAFAIPVIDKVHRAKTSKRSRGIKCIVMAPTRELTQQIGQVFETLANHTKVKTFALFGGVEQERQIARLQDGIDILVTTPGRMFDLINQEVIRLHMVDTLVLDEADHMLDLGFIEDIKYVKKMLTRPHQTLFFSATINDEIRKLAYSQVKSAAIRIQVSPEDKVSRNVSHAVMFVEQDDKRFFLERLLNENPESKMIVFVRTKVRAERVVKAMERVGITAVNIHGDKEQKERTEAMQQFRDGACRIMVATDVSARGIDIPDVSYVINYDLPEKPENYVHRVGRTGRGVNKGTAISFCSQKEKALLEEIQGFLNKPIEVLSIGKEDYAATIALSPEAADLKSLVEEHDAWLNKKRPRRRK
ncbi:ATP-dependent RNA helicase RhlE [Mariprofundus ferrinatatus]|uniref:ATP-dependent RNA helicase RhlE n=1 Tax=Mariprofundus ferrinatatus TaxID=1921087 RepID=A0A2K8LCL8_9PROT|nr:DEAD/DEAH box helicase [Mariprofundus ferrinatatus]ATX82036.1 ATP-dependent RNA helicase RhlE [Mariprofundus ferrinatatus]